MQKTKLDPAQSVLTPFLKSSLADIKVENVDNKSANVSSNQSYEFSDEDTSRKICDNSCYLQLFKYNMSDYKEEKV